MNSQQQRKSECSNYFAFVAVVVVVARFYEFSSIVVYHFLGFIHTKQCSAYIHSMCYLPPCQLHSEHHFKGMHVFVYGFTFCNIIISYCSYIVYFAIWYTILLPLKAWVSVMWCVHTFAVRQNATHNTHRHRIKWWHSVVVCKIAHRLSHFRNTKLNFRCEHKTARSKSKQRKW